MAYGSSGSWKGIFEQLLEVPETRRSRGASPLKNPRPYGLPVARERQNFKSATGSPEERCTPQGEAARTR
jgi:hypothetical protein